MSQPTTPIRVTDVRTVGVPVVDQDQAVDFFVGTLGFEKRMDVPIGDGARWIVVAPPTAATTIALVRSSDEIPAGVETGIRFVTPDADADHADLLARGVAADEVLRWPGVPAMFAFRDPDGNGFEIVEVREHGSDNDPSKHVADAVSRDPAEESQQGWLDLCRHARLGRVLRDARTRQGAGHRGRPPIPKLVHGPRRRHAQAADQSEPTESSRQERGRGTLDATKPPQRVTRTQPSGQSVRFAIASTVRHP